MQSMCSLAGFMAAVSLPTILLYDARRSAVVRTLERAFCARAGSAREASDRIIRDRRVEARPVEGGYPETGHVDASIIREIRSDGGAASNSRIEYLTCVGSFARVSEPSVS